MMDLRAAELDKVHKKILHSTPTCGVTSLTSGAGVFPESSVVMKSAAVVYGINGSGKTRFLKQLSACDDETFDFHNATVTLNPDRNYHYYSPSDEVVLIKDRLADISSADDFDEVLQQFHPIIFSLDEIQVINHILGSSYSSIRIYEIDSYAGGDGEEIIFFAIIEDNYGERNCLELSHGEVYCIHLIWWLKYKLGDDNLLIDEPETYLYPMAQSRLVDMVLKLVGLDDNQILFSTHSRDVVKKLKTASQIYQVQIDGDQCLFLEDDLSREAVFDMGLSEPSVTIFLVEDAKAKKFLECLLRSYSFEADDLKYVIPAKNGEGDLKSIVDRMINTGGVRIVLCYDADVAKNAGVPEAVENISVLLPGVDSPEEELINVIQEKENSYLVKFDESDRVSVLTALRKCAGGDHHDFFVEMSKSCDVDMWLLFDNAFSVWQEQDFNAIKVKEFLSSLEQVYADYVKQPICSGLGSI
ncbi:MAG: hypothetical protein DIZ80_09240 [endosymbiont of Galathealinum brachiosum]|uniref:ATPase AAA-type core domain-containing protein n=1 Tax=endosymbiont of Galathealinum brachiosum TaxID=2200906 RepID=A0A370DC52_9GAMM|nr:MAG: hypothetical protein DIZ80_09240 [endosymbiont of Galathealinum brachiosum]